MNRAERTYVHESKKSANVESLMEGIILQSIEDLWLDGEEDDCINFFRGEGFGICADIAGMNLHDQARLLNFANRIIDL
ncbi:MAG: hypothetical protein EHM54_10160 [Nitrospiraceae bacterium]|nr:MAG: hypothetical protein EHM54_10160 [Nitrospiraceae bacterium]